VFLGAQFGHTAIRVESQSLIDWRDVVTKTTRRGEPDMAAKKKKKAAKKKGKPAELIISKARVKNAVKKCNVGGEFYGALDQAVRGLIKDAEGRATGNKRKTLKAVDL
jgi:histone H3/H4